LLESLEGKQVWSDSTATASLSVATELAALALLHRFLLLFDSLHW
jgi:hypothetical protein